METAVIEGDQGCRSVYSVEDAVHHRNVLFVAVVAVGAVVAAVGVMPVWRVEIVASILLVVVVVVVVVEAVVEGMIAVGLVVGLVRAAGRRVVVGYSVHTGMLHLANLEGN